MPQIATALAPDLVTTMRLALDAASDRVPATSRTPATKAKMAQRIVRAAHEGIRDADQLVAAGWPEKPGAAQCCRPLKSTKDPCEGPCVSSIDQ